MLRGLSLPGGAFLSLCPRLRLTAAPAFATGQPHGAPWYDWGMTIAEQIFEKLKHAPEAVAREVLAYLQKLEINTQAPAPTAKLDDFVGVMKDSPSLNGDPVAVQRALRG